MVAVIIAAGCANRPNRAPIEERVTAPRAAAAASAATQTVPAPADPAVAPLPAVEPGPQPGYYAVKPGDTLTKIGLDNGQSWKDLMRWNGLANANLIEVGQLLRVVPPGMDPALATTRPVTVARVETRALTPLSVTLVTPPAASGGATPAAAALPAGSASAPSAASSAPSVPGSAASGSASLASTAQTGREGEEDIRWGWPANGSVQSPFEEGRAKGLVFAGKAGDPVVAAADGRVVYAGSGLRGYGNLVILKHNSTYLTAYAHNQNLLVREDQSVRRGQKIAEMGSTDADSVQLHFEIRRQGKPIDPAKLLPPR